MTDQQVDKIVRAMGSIASALSWVGFAVMMSGLYGFCGQTLHH